MNTSDKNTNVLKALFEAKSKFAKAEKSKQNSHLKNKYATLDDVLAAVEPGLEDSGLVMFQSMLETEATNQIKVETKIYHAETAEWVAFLTIVPLSKNDCQGTGSSLTYARRYAITAALGLSQADDDGNLAVKSVKDWKKEVEKAETREELIEIYKSCKSQADAATWGIVEKAIIDKQAEIKMASASGFNPAKPKEVAKKVANATNEVVESQSIDQF
ncbi:MAG: ERF family protein [Bacteroidales bacterium]|nr:ERF family protein [Bacteroidales bacterium]